MAQLGERYLLSPFKLGPTAAVPAEAVPTQALRVAAFTAAVGELITPVAGPDPRIADLVAAVAVQDPGWTEGLVRWMPSAPGLERAAIVAALAAARAWVSTGRPGGRALVASALRRPGDPGYARGHWLQRYGRPVPKAVKRGMADAEPPARKTFAAFTGGHGGPLDAGAWAAAIPLMTSRELLQNLWVMDQKGVAHRAMERLAESDLEPLRVYRAHRMMRTPRWDDALDGLLRRSALTLPPWPGRTLVHIDHVRTWNVLPRWRPTGDRYPDVPRRLATAGRMGAVLGAALAAAGNDVDVIDADGRALDVGPGRPVIPAVEEFGRWKGPFARRMVTGRRRYTSYDRVLTLQLEDGGLVRRPSPVPDQVPWYRFRYQRRPTPYEPWGITDGTAHWIPLTEAARRDQWPWS